jgi:hypothetical protein
MIRAAAVLALLCGSLFLQAETVLPAAEQTGCTREELQARVDKYLDALRKGDPSLMPLTPGAKYIENRKETPFGQGIWKKPLDVDFHRSLLDGEICETFTEIIHASGSHPYVLGTRMKVEGDKISEVEALVTDHDDWLFNASNYLKYSSQENWEILSPSRRSDRQTLIRAANAYFDVFSNPSSSSSVPWGIPCARLEGGAYTNPGGDPKASCTGGPPLQGRVDIVNRRYLVDVDMGTVVGLVDFGAQNGWPDSHTFRLENGKVRYVHTLTVCPSGCKIPSQTEKAKTK